jgi:general stress protein YciG
MSPSGEAERVVDLIGFARTSLRPDSATGSDPDRSNDCSTSRLRSNQMASKSEHSSTSEKKAEGQKGVTQEQVGSGKEDDPNNFANNPERASAAGRKGGHESHKRD